MPNPNDRTFFSGRVPVIFAGDINSGDTSNKDLFTLPAGCVIVDGRIVGYNASASNSTSASISVGISPTSGGLGNEFLKNWSVTTAQGSNFQGNVPFTHFGAQASNTWTAGSANQWTVGSNSFVVSGKATGTAANDGSGPWTVILEVLTV